MDEWWVGRSMIDYYYIKISKSIKIVTYSTIY